MSARTVHVVDDDEAMRESLEWLLTPLGFGVHTYPGADALLAAFTPAMTGCVVTDIRMPGMSGLELTDELTRRGSLLPVIVITGHGDVPLAVRAMRAGAIDFIEKPLDHQVLIERIEEGLRLSTQRRAAAEQQRRIAERFAALSSREREVALAVARGKQNKVIAFDLSISQKTVEIHRANAMDKLGATTAADLARMLTLGGLLGENP